MWLTLALTVAHAALPSVDTPIRTGLASPKDAAVVIGIEDYFVLPDVPYAAADAAAFYRHLTATRGVPADRVALLDGAVSRERLVEAVRVAGASVGDGGLVWVYFAGHGAASPRTGERMLLGVDAQSDAATFEPRGVLLSELRALAGAGGGTPVMVLDTCYSGKSRTGDDLVAGQRFAVPSWVGKAPVGSVEWSAAGPDERSGPLPIAAHGAFTYAVLGALRGWADGQGDGRRDGRVSLGEAHAFVQEALRALQVHDQRPVLTGDPLLVLSTAGEERPSLDATLLRDDPQRVDRALVAPAPEATAPGQLQITVAAVVVVRVDGAVQGVPGDETTGPQPIVVSNLSPGRHLVEISGAFGKPITSLDVDVPSGTQVRLLYRAKQLSVVGSGPAVSPPPVSPPVAGTPPATVAPASGPGPTPTGPELQGLLGMLEALPFSDDRLATLRTLCGQYGFTMAQLGQLLDLFPHSSDRIAAVRIVAPVVVGPRSVDPLGPHLTFAEEKRQISQIFADLGG